jgi:hypothetical protein
MLSVPPRWPAPPLEPAFNIASPDEPDNESPDRRRKPPDAPETLLPLDTETDPEEKLDIEDAL